jgi:5-methylcytosine-specific restriction endonuclease McrA
MKASSPSKWESEAERQKFYGSKEWRTLRVYILYRDKTCKKCSLEESPVMAEEIDHIIPIRERPDLRLDPSNLQALCKRCHSVKSYNEVLKGAWERSTNLKPLNKKWKFLDFQDLK